MENKVVMRDVAQKAGVSIATVSRVLNKVGVSIPISQKTKKRVLDVCEELKFEPNIHARRFFLKKSETIGLIIPPQSQLQESGVEHTFSDYNISEILSGVEEAARAKGYKLLLIVVDDKVIENKEYLRLMRNKSLDGLLLWGVGLNDKYVSEIINEGFPLVLINSEVDYSPVNFVGGDDEGGSFQVTTHLINTGHRRIGYICGLANNSVARDREKGFKRALKKAGLSLDNDLIVNSNFSERGGYLAMKKLLGLVEMPTAVVAVNDYTAIGAMKAIKNSGLSIPKDIAITGGDGILLTKYVEPPLTTFKVPMYDIGVRGVNKLLGIIQSGQNKPTRESLKTQLLVRESSGRTP